MSETVELATISSEVENSQRKHSQPNQPKPILRGHLAKVPATIPEIETTDEDGVMTRPRSESMHSKRSNRSTGSKRSHRTKRPVSATNSTQGDSLRPRSVDLERGFDNNGYDGPAPNFERAGARSGETSIRSSVQSLEVQREQYCCFSKWSPCERKLVAAVAVLATVIIILVIIVGVMAGDDNLPTNDNKFQWKF